jgi:hypothetical protein
LSFGRHSRFDNVWFFFAAHVERSILSISEHSADGRPRLGKPHILRTSLDRVVTDICTIYEELKFLVILKFYLAPFMMSAFLM